MSWREQYYQRVRPVVGEAFDRRSVVFWGLQRHYLIAEALARTGVLQQRYLDDGIVADSAFSRSLGERHVGQRRATALAAQVMAHNDFEQGYALSDQPQTLDALKTQLQLGPDLLCVECDPTAGQVARCAIEAGVPFLLSWQPRGPVPASLVLVWHPEAQQIDPRELVGFIEVLAQQPQLDPALLDNQIDVLECSSLALALARWLLARQRPPRPDLELPIFQAGRPVVLRGEPGWPWTVRFARPGARLSALCSSGGQRYRPPRMLANDQERLLVLGLGTASLMCLEAPYLAQQMLLVDCKTVSPFNPVRQAYSTARIGQKKAWALAEILAERADRRHKPTWQPRGAYDELDAGRLRICAAELMLNTGDSASQRHFCELLDAFQPTLAVVAMGRSKDDNFVATAELRRRGIRHVTPTAFPGVSHFKHIITDGPHGPCYDCLQGHLAIDGGTGPVLQPDERELFYGGTQPATLAETLPSAHSLLRLLDAVRFPAAARPGYLSQQLASERNCFVGANRVERDGEGWLYGVDRPFRMVSFGIEHLVGARIEQPCPCGRVNRVRDVIG